MMISNPKASFLPYLNKSFLLHALAVLLIIVIPYILNKLNLSQAEQNLILAKSSVRVDIVAMPKMTIKELQTLDQSEAAKGNKPLGNAESKNNEPKEGEEAFLKEKKKKSFMDVVKSYQNQDIPKSNKEKQIVGSKTGKGSQINDKKLSELLYLGNKVSRGSAIVGTQSDGDITKLEEYASLLPSHVKPFWKLPSYLMDKDYQCRIQIFIAQNGKLVKSKVFQSSGDLEYDKKALEAIQNAEPFPQVPSDISPAVLSGKILLGFPL